MHKFTRCEFGGGGRRRGKCFDEFDLNPQTLFFEGDLGAILAGASGKESSFDLPFTVGLFPLFLQNGIWANDAILGGAVSLTAKNSRALGLSNYDVTFFAAFDNVDNAVVVGRHCQPQQQRRQPLWRNHLHRRLPRLYRSGLRPDTGRRRPGGRPADELRDRSLHPALCQHLVELDPRVRELRGRRERRRLCHHFGEQLCHELAEHAAPLRQLLRRLRQPSAPGRWQWRRHT